MNSEVERQTKSLKEPFLENRKEKVKNILEDEYDVLDFYENMAKKHEGKECWVAGISENQKSKMTTQITYRVVITGTYQVIYTRWKKLEQSFGLIRSLTYSVGNSFETFSKEFDVTGEPQNGNYLRPRAWSWVLVS